VHWLIDPFRAIIGPVRRTVVVASVVAGAAAWGWMHLPNRLFYVDHRPTRLGRLVNDLSGRLYALPLLPHALSTLETAGSRTGRTHATPVVITSWRGERYLVSMLGEGAGWVRNVRAAQGRAVLRHGRRTEVTLEEVPAAERAPILQAYLRAAPGARPHLAAQSSDPLAAFERIAPVHPVFRITRA
jgi:deazaflavin-dependent oxidoreductase (nitroreductase family)